jgi:hypothetical protein
VAQKGDMLVISACNVGDVSSCVCLTSGLPQNARGQEGQDGVAPSCMKVSTRKGECEEMVGAPVAYYETHTS